MAKKKKNKSYQNQNQSKSGMGTVIDLCHATSGSSTVTPSKAIKIETVFSCIRDKAESIGQLPVKLYRVNRDDTVQQIKQGREHRIFTQKPCDYLTMQGFLEMIVVNLELHGAFYAYKERNDRGAIMSIIPFRNQGNVKPAMDHNGNVYYTYVTNDGKIKDPYDVKDLMIVKLFTFDGFTAHSPIAYNAQLLGIANAQEESYKELQENGITSQMALSTDKIFNDENAIKRLKEDWDSYRGSRGVRKIPLLEDGLKPVSLKLTPSESNLLEHREFTVNRICRIFRVPPEIIGVNSTGTVDISAINETYMAKGLNPVIVRIEDALNQLTPDNIKVRIDRKAFYAGSPWKMVEAVEKEVKGGLAMVNEGRVDLGRDPVEGGDVFAVDSNNVTYGTWDELKAIQAQIYSGMNNTNNQGNTDNEK